MLVIALIVLQSHHRKGPGRGGAIMHSTHQSSIIDSTAVCINVMLCNRIQRRYPWATAINLFSHYVIGHISIRRNN